MIFCDFPAFNALFCLLYTKRAYESCCLIHIFACGYFLAFTYSHVDNFLYSTNKTPHILCLFSLFCLAPWLTSHKELIRIVRSFSLSLVSCDFQNQTPDLCGYLLVQLLFFCCILFSICSWHGQLA